MREIIPGYVSRMDLKAEVGLYKVWFDRLRLRYSRQVDKFMEEYSVCSARMYKLEDALKFVAWTRETDRKKRNRLRHNILGSEYEHAIRDLSEKGMTVGEIGGFLSINKETVRQFSRRNGIPINKPASVRKLTMMRTCRDCGTRVEKKGGIIRLYCADCGKKRWLKMRDNLFTPKLKK